MDQVTIRCGSCNNLMAIQSAHLGQQVQCPVCHAVVQTPPPATPPEQAPAQQFDFEANIQEGESIFSTSEQTDDIFGAEPPPQIEIPQESTAPPPIPDFSSEPVVAAPPEATETVPPDFAAPPSTEMPPPPDMDLEETLSYPAPPPEMTPTQEWVPPSPDPAPVPEPPAETTAAYMPPTDPGAPSPELAFSTSQEAETTQATSTETQNENAFAVGPQQRRRPEAGWGTPLLILCLASWAILATIAAAWLKYRETHYRPPHPLELVPDLEGDKPGARKVQGEDGPKLPPLDRELASHLVIGLGETLTLGNLRVTTGKAEWSKVQLVSEEGGRPLNLDGKALKLHLKLENVSTNVAFAPLDAFFVRRFPAGKRPNEDEEAFEHTERGPYNYLLVGEYAKGLKLYEKNPLYGGPAGWNSVRSRRQREFVVGQQANAELMPGKTMDTFVCTDPIDPKATKLFNKMGEKEKLFWRIRLRRGVVEHKGKLKSATAVIGVRFTADQIQ